MSDRRYGVYERLDTGDEWPLSSIPDDLVEEAAKRLRAKSGIRLFDYETLDEIDDLARAALSVLFPGEEESRAALDELSRFSEELELYEDELSGDCETDCQEACAYPGQFTECEL